MHLSGAGRDECRPVAAKLGAYVRGGLTKRDVAVVGAHLDQCAQCRRVFAVLGDVGVALKGIVAPIVLGPSAVAYWTRPAVLRVHPAPVRRSGGDLPRCGPPTWSA